MNGYEALFMNMDTSLYFYMQDCVGIYQEQCSLLHK